MLRDPLLPRARSLRALTLLAVAPLCLAPLSVAHADEGDPPPEPIRIALLGVNDFEGSLGASTVKFAGTIEQLRAEHGEDNTLLLLGGDNLGFNTIGHPTLDGNAFAGNADILPTIEVMNALDVAATAVGNHDYHYGAGPLLGEFADDAEFSWLSANTYKSNARVFAAYDTFEVGGVQVAVIGATTRDTPLVNPQALLAGHKFLDPVADVNATAAALKALPDPPEVIVAVYHEGAKFTPGLSTQARIVYNTSADVDAIFTAHTHGVYPPLDADPGSPVTTRPVIQSGHGGTMVGEAVLTLDPVTHEVIGATQDNKPLATASDATLIAQYPRVAAVKSIVDAADANWGPVP